MRSSQITHCWVRPMCQLGRSELWRSSRKPSPPISGLSRRVMATTTGGCRRLITPIPLAGKLSAKLELERGRHVESEKLNTVGPRIA